MNTCEIACEETMKLRLDLASCPSWFRSVWTLHRYMYFEEQGPKNSKPNQGKMNAWKWINENEWIKMNALKNVH